MNRKNLRHQETNSTKNTGKQHPGMVELSDEALSQVWGGRNEAAPLEIPEPFYPDPNPNRES
jgi:hypothetical protein